jgi:hypothetical protein
MLRKKEDKMFEEKDINFDVPVEKVDGKKD